MINKADYKHFSIQKYLSNTENIAHCAIRASSENSQVYEVHLKGKEHLSKIALKVYGEQCKPAGNISYLLNHNPKHIVKILQYRSQMPAYVTMQLCQQDLKQAIVGQKECLPSDVKLRYIRQISQGMLSLKLLKLIHGDIKPENILIDQQNTIKIADIDYLLREHQFSNSRIRMGTLPYMAPQVMTNWNCSYASDIWSLGVVIYEIYFGQTPFVEIQKLDPRKEHSIQHSNLIIKQRLQQKRTYIKNCIKQSIDCISTAMLEAMLQCLVWNACDRAQIQDIIGLLQNGKVRRKCSQSTDYSAIHYQDDLFILPNTSLLLAFQKLTTILSFLPQEISKFKDLQPLIQEINQKYPQTPDTLKVIKQLIQQKYQKMNRIFERLAKIEGGIDYSKKGKLFHHLGHLIKLLDQEIQSFQWIKQNSSKSTESL